MPTSIASSERDVHASAYCVKIEKGMLGDHSQVEGFMSRCPNVASQSDWSSILTRTVYTSDVLPLGSQKPGYIHQVFLCESAKRVKV